MPLALNRPLSPAITAKKASDQQRAGHRAELRPRQRGGAASETRAKPFVRRAGGFAVTAIPSAGAGGRAARPLPARPV